MDADLFGDEEEDEDLAEAQAVEDAGKTGLSPEPAETGSPPPGDDREMDVDQPVDPFAQPDGEEDDQPVDPFAQAGDEEEEPFVQAEGAEEQGEEEIEIDPDEDAELFGDSGSDDENAGETAIVTEPPPVEPKRTTIKRYVPRGRTKLLQTTLLPAPPDDAELCLVQVPSVIGFEHRVFEDDKYVPPTSRRKTTWVRWRVGMQDGVHVKESNTKIVTWSDGSKSMVIGKEVFDIAEHPVKDNFLYGHYFVDESEEPETAEGAGKIVNLRLAQCQGAMNKKWNVMASLESQKRAARNINLQHMTVDKTKRMTAEQRQKQQQQEVKRTMGRQKLKKRQRVAQQENQGVARSDLTSAYLEQDDSAESSGAEHDPQRLLSAKHDDDF